MLVTSAFTLAGPTTAASSAALAGPSEKLSGFKANDSKRPKVEYGSDNFRGRRPHGGAGLVTGSHGDDSPDFSDSKGDKE